MTTALPQESVPRRTTALWALVVTGAAGFMASLDNLVVTTALPSIRRDLGGQLSDLEWTVSAYTLTFAVLLMFGAALGDRFGRRRMFMTGLVVFTGASAAAALSNGMTGLIAARAVQGFGAAIMMPLTLTLLTAAVPAARRGTALGVWGAVNGLAIATGPLIGGTLTEHLSWHWIFWLNVPIGIVLLPFARLRLNESHGRTMRIDVPGTVLVSLGLFGIVYGLIRGNADGWGSPVIVVMLAGGAVLLAAFVGYELRAANPMLPMRMFRDRGFSAVNATSLLMFLGMFGSVFLLSQFLQGVQGFSPVQAGLRMLPWTAMPMVVAPIAGTLSDRIGSRPVMALGMACQATGLAWFAVIMGTGVSFGRMIPALAVSGIGMSLYFSPSANALMGTVAPHEQGIASGANNAVREIGGALGVAVLASVFSANGSYASGQDFVNGITPALWTGAAAVATGVGAALLIPRRGPAKAAPAEQTAPQHATA